LFCGSCILEWLSRNPCCPLCRTNFLPQNLIRLGDTHISHSCNLQKLPSKLEALLQILDENPNGRFLIFSRYENPFEMIECHLQKKSYTYALLKGNKDVISNTLHDFQKGKLKILLMNSRDSSAGMDIPSTTHIILYHKMNPEEEKQILGRAYRLGRTEPLNFIHLLHEKE